MRIQSSPPDFITTGFWNEGFLKTAKHGAGQHYRAAQRTAFIFEFGASQNVQVNIISLKDARVPVQSFNLYTNGFQEFYKIVYIENVGYVGDGYFFICQ